MNNKEIMAILINLLVTSSLTTPVFVGTNNNEVTTTTPVEVVAVAEPQGNMLMQQKDKL